MATVAQPRLNPPTLSFLSGLRNSFLGNALNARFLFSLGVFVLIAIFGFLGPAISGRTDPMATVGGLYDPPSADALLGTDNFGRDVFTQLMYGTRASLTVGFVSGSIAILIGLVVGTVAGYVGGAVEELLMALTNVIITIPAIVILILLSISV